MPRLGRERSAVLLVAWTLLGLAPGVRAQLAAAAWRFAGNAGRGFVGPVIALRDSSTDSLYLLHDRDGSSLAPAFLWRSDDFGVTWNTLRSSSPDTLVSLKADPFRSGAVLALHATAVGELQIWESDDRGGRWQLNGGPGAEPYSNSAALLVSPLVPDRLYVSGQGLWRSEDRGKTWALLSSVARSGLVEHQTDPDVLVAIAPGLPLLMRSVDGGYHWHLLSQVLEEGALYDFALAPSDPDRVYATSSRGILRSDDGGRNWSVVRSLEPGSCLLPTVDASDRDRLLLADLCAGRLLASRDGGDEWTEVSLPQKGGAWSFAVEPRDLADLWFTNGDLRHSLDGGLSSRTAPTQVPGGERVHFLDGNTIVYAASSTSSRISIWRAGGSHWLRRGTSPRGVQPAVVDPRRPETIYYASYRALWRSVDGGKTLARLHSDLETDINELTFDRHRPGRLLAATSEDGWRSDDGGVRWTKFTAGIPTGSANFPTREVSRIAQDAAARDTLYVVRDEELFVSTDGGATWRSREVPAVADGLKADPFRPNTLYLPSTLPTVLYESDDGGRSWSWIPLPHSPIRLTSRPVLRFDRRGNLAVFATSASDCSALDWPILRGIRDRHRWHRLGARLPSGCVLDLVATESADGATSWLAAVEGAGTWQLDLPSSLRRPPGARQPVVM